jgi:hypothetical protein
VAGLILNLEVWTKVKSLPAFSARTFPEWIWITFRVKILALWTEVFGLMATWLVGDNLMTASPLASVVSISPSKIVPPAGSRFPF